MELQEKLLADLKEAMLAQDTARVSVLRMLKSSLKNAEIELMHPLSEAEAVKVVKKEIKKRKDSVESFTAAGQPERAAQEAGEATILERYIPADAAETTPEAIEGYINSYLAEHPEHTANKGLVIKAAVSHFAGAADNRLIAETVNRILG